jgi:hypothetical protein
VGEDVRDGELLLLALRGFGLVGCERRDVDQGGDAVVRPRVRDQGTAVRVTDKDHRAADPPETTGDAVHVAFQGVQAVLGADHLVPIRLQRGDQLLEA